MTDISETPETAAVSDPAAPPATPEAIAPADAVLLWSEPETAATGTVILAHGAGSTMDSPFMNRMAEALAERGLRVARFEFAYMAGRRTSGKRRPPPEASLLIPEYRAVVDQVLATGPALPVIVAGKSMGGRVAVMTAGEALDGSVAGVAVLGYPFHPIAKPETLRLAPLAASLLPVMVLQGERDEFGNRTLVEGLDLPAVAPRVEVRWIEDGSHDFGPRGGSPATLKGNIAHAADEVTRFVAGLAPAA